MNPNNGIYVFAQMSLVIISALLLGTASGQGDGLSAFFTGTLRSNRVRRNLLTGKGCDLPSSGRGVCTVVQFCPPVFSYLRDHLQSNRTQALDYIKVRLCQIHQMKLIVCCPTSSSSTVTSSSNTSNTGNTGISNNDNNRNNYFGANVQCGITDAVRVLGGKEIEPGSEPWLAGLGRPRGSKFVVTCGGTIITKRHVLSASHCFDGVEKPTHVRLGEHNLLVENDNMPTQTIPILSRKNPNYIPNTVENDLELLYLGDEIFFDPHIKRACLPFDLPKSNEYVNQTLSIVGWGETENGTPSNFPNGVEVRVSERSSCRAAYRGTQVDINEKKLCAGDDGKDSCRGDSGGPLLFKQQEKVYLVGIVSFGLNTKKCRDVKGHGVYTRVSEYLDWIRNNV